MQKDERSCRNHVLLTITVYTCSQSCTCPVFRNILLWLLRVWSCRFVITACCSMFAGATRIFFECASRSRLQLHRLVQSPWLRECFIYNSRTRWLLFLSWQHPQWEERMFRCMWEPEEIWGILCFVVRRMAGWEYLMPDILIPIICDETAAAGEICADFTCLI